MILVSATTDSFKFKQDNNNNKFNKQQNHKFKF